MDQKEFQKSFEAIESEALAGRMSVSGALARVALLSIDYARNNLREARLTSEAIDFRSSKVKPQP